MSFNDSTSQVERKTSASLNGKKKIFENPVLSPIIVPLAIVLVGGLIVFGLTSLLSSGKDYRDLVRELESKTFGNRWIAAYELSKVIAQDSLRPEEKLWMNERLSALYRGEDDERTQEFLLVALSSLNLQSNIPILLDAAKGTNSKLSFHALLGLSHFSSEQLKGQSFDFLNQILEGNDPGLVQAAVLLIGHLKLKEFKGQLLIVLNNESSVVALNAAYALLAMDIEEGKVIVRDFLLNGAETYKTKIKDQEIEALQLNALKIIDKNEIKGLESEIKILANQHNSLKVMASAREILEKDENESK